MSWIFLNSGSGTGYYNMELDIELTKNLRNDEAFLRLYRWNPYCISLGKHQSFDDINTQKAHNDNIDIVKRPTGGRAILHAEELTYSVILPVSSKLSPKDVYTRVSLALVNGLSKYHPSLKEVVLQSRQPDFKKILNQPEGKLCFAITAKSELTFSGKKLVGSAQRKMGNVILQHGSILCGSFHKNLINYINSDRQDILDLNENTCEIESIVGGSVDYDRLSDCIKLGFEAEWGINFKDKVNFTIPQINS
jgi:lipoate-protein ligase A